jgi:WD40 repeat protein
MRPICAVLALAFAVAGCKSPDRQPPRKVGRVLACTMKVGGEWGLWLLYLDQGEQKLICACENPGGDWTADGHQLVYTDGRSLRLIRSDGADDRALPGLPGFDPQWSADDASVVYGTGKSVQSRSMTGNEFRVWSFGDQVFEHPTWSPDGTRVAMTDNLDRLVISDGASQKSVPLEGAGRPDWSPDGRLILLDHPDNVVRVLDVETREIRPLGNARGSAPRWLKDGSGFVTVWKASGDDTVSAYLWDAKGIAGDKLTSRDEVREAASNW